MYLAEQQLHRQVQNDRRFCVGEILKNQRLVNALLGTRGHDSEPETESESLKLWLPGASFSKCPSGSLTFAVVPGGTTTTSDRPLSQATEIRP